MKDGLKKIFWFGVFLGLFFWIFKFVKKIIALKNISQTLPQYLENLIGEKPTIKITLSFNKAYFKIYISQKTINGNPELENTIKEYISDFYPEFPPEKISLEILPPEQEKEENPDNIKPETEAEEK